MDAPRSRRALLASLAASATAVGSGCVGRIPQLDGSTGPITVLALGTSNGLDRPIELSIVLRTSGETALWRSIELEPSGDHVIPGPWVERPGDLEVIARYRPLADPGNAPGEQHWDYSLTGEAGDCIALEASIEAYRGLVVWEIEPPDEVGSDCQIPAEWER